MSLLLLPSFLLHPCGVVLQGTLMVGTFVDVWGTRLDVSATATATGPESPLLW